MAREQAAPWFPVDAVTTPFDFSLSVREVILLIAPLNLKDPVEN